MCSSIRRSSSKEESPQCTKAAGDNPGVGKLCGVAQMPIGNLLINTYVGPVLHLLPVQFQIEYIDAIEQHEVALQVFYEVACYLLCDEY